MHLVSDSNVYFRKIYSHRIVRNIGSNYAFIKNEQDSLAATAGVARGVWTPIPKHRNEVSIPNVGETRKGGSTSHLKLLNVNCQSLKNKRGAFQNLVDGCNPDIVVATETWLTPEQADGEIGEEGRFSEEYSVHRRDRSVSPGGGVLVAIRRDLNGVRRVDLETDCELLWVKIDIIGSKSLYVGGFYRPHVNDKVSAESLKNSLSRIIDKTNSHIWVAGDFNYPGIDWRSGGLKPNCSYPMLHRDFIDMLEDYSMTQIIQDPTRDSNTLDLFITSNETLINNAQVIPGISDHDAVVIESALKPNNVSQYQTSIPVWKKADWCGMQKYFSSNWFADPHINENATAEQLWVKFRTIIEDGIQKFVPHKRARKKDHHPWISNRLKREIRKQKRLYSNKKKSPTDTNLTNYRLQQSEVQRLFRREYWSYITSILVPQDQEAPSDRRAKDKRFFTYIKNCKRDSIGIAPIRNQATHSLETDPVEKAELLNKQFQSVFSLNEPIRLADICKSMTNTKYGTMPDFTISAKGIEKLLAELNPHKAAGPDAIRPLVLKELRRTIAPALCTIFSRSYKTGQVPGDWRTANIAPIFKKGCRNTAANYRPVSLTCICSKLMEHIMVSQISNHLDKQKILSPYQHGFRVGKSCETQLIEFIEDLHDHLRNKVEVDAVVMDFSKAFDKVAHNRLLLKLHDCGIQGRAHAWIKSFLTGRTQRVLVEGSASGYIPVTSGVPQGSVLGPVLFLIYINDIANNLTSSVRLFADDTIVYRVIRTPTDRLDLQKDLHKLESWSKHWQMHFHPAKCKAINFSRSRHKSLFAYQLYQESLETVSHINYLGVTITNDLRWNKHIENTKNRANYTLRFLKRNLSVSSPKLKTQAYFTYVRPKLEYAVSVWDPHTNSNIGQIEMVQRRAARWALGRYCRTSSVGDMLKILDWRSLKNRRTDARLTMFYKIVNGHVIVDKPLAMRPMEGIIASAHPHRFIPHQVYSKVHGASFFPSSILRWNALPNNIAAAPSLDSFKKQVSCLQHN